MLQFPGLNQYYGESHILWDIALTVPEGSCVCLMGRNGVGKTTLLKAIMGLLPINGGSIQFRRPGICRPSGRKRVRSGIAYVPQGREIFPQLTVEENLRIGLAARQIRHATSPRSLHTGFRCCNRCSGRRGGDLSGGQQQQLAIGRALVTQPQLLILDEPTEGIQPNIVHEIGDIIHGLTKKRNLPSC